MYVYEGNGLPCFTEVAGDKNVHDDQLKLHNRTKCMYLYLRQWNNASVKSFMQNHV